MRVPAQGKPPCVAKEMRWKNMVYHKTFQFAEEKPGILLSALVPAQCFGQILVKNFLKDINAL